MLTAILRREHKNRWERRAALIPQDIAELKKSKINVDVEPCDIRAFSNEAYVDSGAQLSSALSEHQLVLGIKEPPVLSIAAQQVHLCFSHTIKGQPYNMGLLQKFIDQKATLIDYEPIVDGKGQRTIAFGRFAGIAGAIDSFYVLGQKLRLMGRESAFSNIVQTKDYQSIAQIKTEFAHLNWQQERPVRVLVVGSGNVGKGSIEVCEWLGLKRVAIEDVLAQKAPAHSWFSVASSHHLHERIGGGAFDYEEYLRLGKEQYRSVFDRLLGQFDVLIQTPYWTEKYPAHLDVARMNENMQALPLVVGDISCDINGSLKCTKKISTIDHPAYSYYIDNDSIHDGIHADGVSVMAIDNLPCELPVDASTHFSKILARYVPELMRMDLAKPLESCGIGEELRGAVIVYNGELTSKFSYLTKYLEKHQRANTNS